MRIPLPYSAEEFAALDVPKAVSTQRLIDTVRELFRREDEGKVRLDAAMRMRRVMVKMLSLGADEDIGDHRAQYEGILEMMPEGHAFWVRAFVNDQRMQVRLLREELASLRTTGRSVTDV